MIYRINIIFLVLVASLLVGCGDDSSGFEEDLSTDDSTDEAQDTSTDQGTDDTGDDTSSDSQTSDNPWGVEIEKLHALAPFPIGVAVGTFAWDGNTFGDDEEAQIKQKIIKQHFNQMTAGNGMKMSYLHPQEDTFNFDDLEPMLSFASQNNVSIHGHALVWHSDYQVPQWMKNYTGNWESMVENHVSKIVSHFAQNHPGLVVSWDVVNEAFNDDGTYRTSDSVFYHNMQEEYIEVAFRAAREADGLVDLYYNDFNLAPNHEKLQAVLEMVDDFQSRDVPIDGIGFQMHLYLDWPSISNIRSSFTAVAQRGLKVKITELDIPINNPYSGQYSYPDNYVEELTIEHAKRQRRRFCEIVEAYMDDDVVPPQLRGGLSVWGIEDSDSWLEDAIFNNYHRDWPLLFDDEFNQKPAIQGVADALNGLSCM